MKRILSILLALSMLVACVGMLPTSAEDPSYLEMTNGAGGDPGNAIVLGAGNYYAVHFNVTTAFTGIRIAQWTPGAGAGSVDWTLAVYAWDGDFATSRAGTPVAQTSGTSTVDNLAYDLTFDKEVPAGNYAAVLSVDDVNDPAKPGMHLQTGTVSSEMRNCFEWETDAMLNNYSGRAASFKLIAGSGKDASSFIALDAESSGETEQDFTTKTVSELFWVAKLTVGEGGEVKDSEEVDFGTPDDPTLQNDLTPREYVTHVSFDEVRPGVICNQAANGDKLITLPTVASPQADGTVTFWGWLGAAGKIVNFSYSVDGGEKVDVEKFQTEDGVIAAAMTVPGTKAASRYQVNIPVEANGTYVVRLYVNMQVKDPVESEPEDPGEQDPTTETVSELFWVAKLTVGEGGEVKDSEEIDFGTPDDPALQAVLAPSKYVTHASYDEVRPGIICNQDQNGDKYITLPTVAGPEEGKNTVMFFGWVGASGKIVNFSYSIDGGEKIDIGRLRTGQDVIDVAMRVHGTVDVSRYQVNVPVEANGTYVVRIYANIQVTDSEEPDPGEDSGYIDWSNSEEAVGSSWDTIYFNKEATMPDGFTDGHVDDYMAEHEGTIDGSDGSLETVYVRGWVGFTQEVTAMGYCLDDNKFVFFEDAISEAEDAVKAAGGAYAIRFMIPIDVSGLFGSHSIVVVAKLANGMIIALTNPSQMICFTYRGPDWPAPVEPSEKDPTTGSVSELFWIAKLTVGEGGEVKDPKKIDFGTPDNPALQEHLVPGEYVTHASYDEVRPGIICNQEWNGDKFITLPTVAKPQEDGTVTFWGWIGAAGEIVNFSYSIDGGEKVDVDKYDTEQAVVDAAMRAEGTVDASRFQVNVPVAANGTYIVRIYVNMQVKDPEEPDPEKPGPGEDYPSTGSGYIDWSNSEETVASSWDSIYFNEEGNLPAGFTDGHVNEYMDAHDGTIDGSNGSIKTVYVRGWIGFKQEVTAMGYCLDGNKFVYFEDAVLEADDAVKGAAGAYAVRFMIPIDVSDLFGSHSIVVVAKLANGMIIAVTNPSQRICFTYRGPDRRPAPVEPSEKDPATGSVSELFWIAKLTVGEGGEVKDPKKIDFGTPDNPALQEHLVPGEYVTHVSYDEVRPGIVCGQEQNGDVNITLPTVKAPQADGTVMFWGWVGAAGEIVNFSYSIDGGEKVDVDKYATEQPVVDAAMGVEGTVDASRFQVNVPVAANGTYIVRIYVNMQVEDLEEPSKPYVGWTESGKAVASSWDTIYFNEEGTLPDGFTDGLVNEYMDAHDGRIDGSDGSIETVYVRGWVGFTQEITAIGYCVHDRVLVYTEGAMSEAETAIKLAGGEFAVRFTIPIDVSDLVNEYNSIVAIAKLADGTVVAMTNPGQPVKFIYEGPKYNPATGPYAGWSDWSVRKKTVGSSWDTIYFNEEGTMPDGFTDGHVNEYMDAHDGTIDGSDGSIETVYVGGWIGFKQEITAIGYYVDHDYVWVSTEGVMSEAEEAVKAVGGEYAVRFMIPIDVSNLFGRHPIVVIVKIADGTVIAATRPEQPIEFVYRGPEYLDWDESGEAVGSSWDSIYINEDGAAPDDSPDGNANDYMEKHDGTIDGTDGSISTVYVRGWIGFKQEIVAIGYTIDGETTIFVDNALVPDGDPAKEVGNAQAIRALMPISLFGMTGRSEDDPIKEGGGEYATRFLLPIDVTGLTGKHEIVVVAKLADGTVVAATNPEQKMSFTYEGPESTDKPSDPTTTPSDPTATPSDPTEKPSEPTETPPEPTVTPSEPTQTPPEPTVTPSEPTETPPEPTVKPSEPTETPPEPTVTPSEPTQTPPEPTVTPSEPTETPPEPTVTPSEPTETPPEPTVTPSEPTQTPPEPTVKPSEPTETPPEPTVTPSEPTQTPPEPTVKPSEPTETPPEPTIKPSDSTDKPDNPGTGDNVVAIFALVLIGAAMAFSVAVVLKKRFYNK